jgi:hypothetical protein
VLFLSAPDVVLVARRFWRDLVAMLAPMLVLSIVMLAAEGSPPYGAGLVEVSEEAQLAFSLGSSLAMLGQSSRSPARPLFEMTLQRLAFPPGETARLLQEYEQMENDRQNGQIEPRELEAGRAKLLREVAGDLEGFKGREPPLYVYLGYDLSHLFLMLMYWSWLEADDDPLILASHDIDAIRASARQMQLPAEVEEELEELASRNLAQPIEREAALRSLRKVLRLFSFLPDQGG